jgi:hypothetical protein
MGTIGSNAGGQLNIIMFEVGMLKRFTGVGATLPPLVLLAGIHPLLVAPRSIRYTDPSRSQVTETVKSSHEVQAGRGLRTVQIEGTFGVENRGLLLYLGTGEVRFQRFYKEVVRLSEAMSKDDVKACTDIINGTPGISLILKPYNEDDTRFFINFFDFWNGRQFQAIVRNWSDTRAFRPGGAQGLVNYSMVVEEVGPIIGGNLGTAILNTLFDALVLWNSVNNAIESYTPSNILDSFAAAGAIVTSELADTVEAVQAQIDSVTSLMGGSSTSSLTANNTGIASFLQSVERLKTAATATARSVASNQNGFDAENGMIRAASLESGTGALGTFDTTIAALDIVDAADFNLVAGCFFGMSREDYATYLTSAAYSGTTPPDLSGSFTHNVNDTDTGDSVEKLYGVEWGRILSLNNLTPDEALIAGTALQIPSVRPKGPQGIAGLPTFGSHVGPAAWGSDLPCAIIADDDGDLVTISGEPLLEQGAAILLSEKGDEITQKIENVPSKVRSTYIREKITALLLTDQRFVAVEDLTVALNDTGIDVQVSVSAINGGQATVGGS